MNTSIVRNGPILKTKSLLSPFKQTRFFMFLHAFEITHFYILFLHKIPEYGGVGGFPSVFRRRWSSVPSFHGLHMSHYSLVVFYTLKNINIVHVYSFLVNDLRACPSLVHHFPSIFTLYKFP